MVISHLPIDWGEIRQAWTLPPDVTYLNHGSFGLSPLLVQESRKRWRGMLDAEPMDFFVRQLEPAWLAARERLAIFVGSEMGNIAFVENATSGMNDIASSFPLAPKDEILITDHAYGVVKRIWERAAKKCNASVQTVAIPLPVESQEAIADAIETALTDRTRLLVISHITSPTAILLPMAAIIERLHARGIAICIDGPHAVAQLPLQLDELGADFYTASCHKWLCAPFGSGFLHVHPRWQNNIQPASLSWGRVQPAEPENWDDEYIWTGTRDPSPFLAIPAAIDFLESIGWETFRKRSHQLAQIARHALERLINIAPVVPDDPAFYAGMTLQPLPPGDHSKLQGTLWEQFKIETPVIRWNDQWFIRVSCHLYNSEEEIEKLIHAMKQLI